MATKKSAKPVKINAAAKPRTKSEITGTLAEATGLPRKQVVQVFDALGTMIAADLGKGPKVFTVPGMMKITVVKKPAVPARKGINPFTGQEQMFKAKPARNVIKIRPLKAMKEMV